MIAVPLRSGIKQECSPPEFVLNCVRGILASVLIQGKEMIGIQTGKEETQASVFESTEASVCKIQRQRQVLGRAWSSRNPHASWRGGQDAAATLEDSLVVSYKIRHCLTP